MKRCLAPGLALLYGALSALSFAQETGPWGGDERLLPRQTVATTVTGFVLGPDGAPARGAVVVTSAGGRGVSDERGAFACGLEAPFEARLLMVTAAASLEGTQHTAHARVPLVPLGWSDAGTLALEPSTGCSPEWLPTFGARPGVANDVFALAVFDDDGGPALYAGGASRVRGAASRSGTAPPGRPWGAGSAGRRRPRSSPGSGRRSSRREPTARRFPSLGRPAVAPRARRPGSGIVRGDQRRPPRLGHQDVVMSEISFLRIPLVCMVLADLGASVPRQDGGAQAAELDRSVVEGMGASLERAATHEFTRTGIRLSVPPGQRPGWEWSLRLRGAGRSGEVLPVGDPAVHREAGRVEYRREGIVEWYAGHRRGLEHGFTLEEPPATAARGWLRLELEVGGTLRGQVLAGERGARFVTEAGAGALVYEGLVVWDASGRSLPARLALEGSGLAIEIEDEGARWPVVVDPVIYTEDAVIVPADPDQHWAFGGAAAGDGDTLVAGDHRAHGVIPWTGGAFVYVRSGAGWTQQGRLFASDGATNDYFGLDVAICGDTVVVGSQDDDDHGTSSGSAYVFSRSGTTWTQTQKLTASDAAQADSFGSSVSIQGTTVLVGAPGDDDMGQGSGSVYVFCHDGTSWVQTAKLVPPDGGHGDRFGYTVLLHEGYAFCAAHLDEEGGIRIGSVYVYEGACSSWILRTKIVPGDGVSWGAFGHSVAAHGSRLAIGSIGATGASWGTGAVYLYQGTAASWTLEAKLFASDGEDQDAFGWALAMSEDLVLVSSPAAEGLVPDAGACYLLQHLPSGWTERAKLVASDGHASGALGTSVVRLGGTLLAGAWSQGPLNHGAVYVYELLDQIESYCFGDGSGSPCPCANESPPGSQAGCNNSTGTGARLLAGGTSSVGADDLVLDAGDLVPDQPGLCFAGENAVNGGAGLPFGDGLRCAGANVVRLSVQIADPSGNASWGPGLALQGGWQAGDQSHFQVWYRDPTGSPCGAGLNTTNGIAVRWVQ